jgi:hypothetical protein
MILTIDVPLMYETNYYAGVGPYYSSDIFTGIDDTMHYEEYGFDFQLYGTAEIDLYFGNYGVSDYYWFGAVAEADVAKLTPGKVCVWFQRPLAAMQSSGTASIHAWMGAGYDFEVGSAFVSYVEAASTGYSDLWTATYWTQSPASSGDFEYTWDDPVYYVDLVSYVPANIA